MAQWINLNRNNSFVNRMRLPLLCSHTPSATAGRQAVWQAVRQAGRPNTVRFENFLNCLPIALLGFSRILTKERCDHRVTNVFRSFFPGKMYCVACCGGMKK